ncbi:hypothetical protein WR25_23557 [Diploscapter pachys]|uniref:Octanoyl-[acyl-carrier-protein]:protein N-octanoyltransferase LIPT2, mitochondrial n=1 Tax=Diploscapter pachys TaxID=2018661 RepID=A0A2A2KKB2_9BILA|nr:hypothetical protein WR25_23557 [Diploscapter pachys]
MHLSRNLHNSFKLINLGRLSYSDALAEQRRYVEEVKTKRELSGSERGYLLAVEHNPVYTIGIRTKMYDSEEDEKKLRNLGAEFHRTSRGGLITFHGPGQLVVYPIFDLRSISPKPLGVRKYVDNLEQVIIDTATEFGISRVGRTENTGVWVDGTRKIAAIGVAVSHSVSYHGIAINANVDLKWFDHIVACGIEGVETTSFSKELHKNISPSHILPPLVQHFSRIFNAQLHQI